MPLTGSQRIRLVLQGARADRIPYSFWTHLPSVDLEPEKLAAETFRFYKTYDLDFIKNMPNGLFSVEDFGCVCDYSEIALGGVAKIKKYAVQKPEDWRNLIEPDVRKGAFGRELLSLEYLLKMVKEEAPVIATVFSPLTTAYKLCGPEVIQQLKHHPEKLKAGLDLIAHVTKEFALEALRKGCSGVYFANQMATREFLTEEEYAEFGVPYDLKVLKPIHSHSWFNVMHIHGTNIIYKLLANYPVQALNWHIWETEPTIETMLKLAPDKVIVGGLQRAHITNGSMTNLRNEVLEVSRITNGNKIILSPGCVIRYPVNKNVLVSLRKEIIRNSKKFLDSDSVKYNNNFNIRNSTNQFPFN
ncbi:uroporphyrinogen decarboxylase family protein [Neobacillus niacini]|uniref:uroporphyrinogen decarboxylase family protein n=1 Tax=Neobacillus niacini TaxID=86668 RepID=UPI0007AB94A8|nr:uroporphyrinogen decarboxylase family protein [Neobacillus niacini]MEC1523863.1 uroporphyrinogen decarboxylase family protein [Neobacillus niacini]